MDIFPEALDHFKNLLKFNTANPPGNEREAIAYINEVLSKEGHVPFIVESAEKRANLVVRLKGNGSSRPLLITSHIDVVNVEPSQWKYPPFSATEAEGCVWGRGAIDMKNMTAYCLSTFLNLARSKTPLRRDVIMSVVADEEVGGNFGMGFLTKKYSDLLNAEYALGELGGYTLHFGKKRVYPIQVGEKGIFWIKVKFRGDPGHGSIPKLNNAQYKLAHFLNCLERKAFPYHRTESGNAFFKSLGKTLGPIKDLGMKVINSRFGPPIMKRAARKSSDQDRTGAILAMLTNTANPTGLVSGRQHNVVPSEVTLNLDCRLLPGFTGQDVVGELEKLTGQVLDYELVQEGLGHESSFETPLFKLMEKKILEADPGASVVPSLTVGYTDAQYLKKLGITCYGFTPVKLPADMSYPTLYHGHNERIPIEGFKWGLDVFRKTVNEFCT